MITLGSRQDPRSDKREEVQAQIAALYRIHALEIAQALGDKPLCIVTGPRRFGKSTTLLPTLVDIFQGGGRSADIINGRNYEVESFGIDTLPSKKFDVLIIDEANVVTRTTEKTEHILRLLHDKGQAVISVITFDAGYEPGGLYLAKIWQAAELSLSGHTANLVRLPQMVLSPQIAREILMLHSARTGAVRSRVVSYIVERVPPVPYILFELVGAKTIADVNRIIRERKSTRFEGALSSHQYRELEQSLEA